MCLHIPQALARVQAYTEAWVFTHACTLTHVHTYLCVLEKEVLEDSVKAATRL